ncbi:crossover junction endodeoxyribonuclease RuvC [Rhodospirillaceae bacterium AH-315-P19]|nr:crossover junction endodeoxyribonuclease RuvC [Rhodospirillaceae bacterium AH-315-P19]
MRLLGLDPGLRRTGWGVIDVDGNRLRHVGDGAVRSDDAAPMSERLVQLYDGLCEVIAAYQPDAAAVEDIFVNRNPATTLKLGFARGVVLLAPAKAGLSVAEYSTTLIKKSVVGTGHATKKQIGMMVATLLPGARPETEDAADALAVAICHAHHRATWQRWTDGAKKEARL